MQSVLGTILDPAADKTLMTTLTVTLAIKGMVPRSYFSLSYTHNFNMNPTRAETHPLFVLLVPLAVIILGRDVLLSLSAFYIRYTSLPSPVSSTFLPHLSSLVHIIEYRKRLLDIGISQYLQLRFGQHISARQAYRKVTELLTLTLSFSAR